MMNIQAIISGTVASLALLTLTTTSAFANTKTLTPNASNLTGESQVAQRQKTPMPAQANPTMQQSQQMGCSCCKNMPGMMNNQPGRMNNMPGMMNRPSSSN